MGWRTTAAVLDAGTAFCATLNSAYFLARLMTSARETAARRWALSALALLSLGALLESVYLLASASQGQSAVATSVASGLARFLLFAGSACMSALIVRQGARG
jgi:hypothetical protein